jgi:hypothetical protein
MEKKIKRGGRKHEEMSDKENQLDTRRKSEE